MYSPCKNKEINIPRLGINKKKPIIRGIRIIDSSKNKIINKNMKK